jgi:hypothetical protein
VDRERGVELVGEARCGWINRRLTSIVLGCNDLRLGKSLARELIREHMLDEFGRVGAPLFSVPKVTVRTWLDREDWRGSVRTDTRECLSGLGLSISVE